MSDAAPSNELSPNPSARWGEAAAFAGAVLLLVAFRLHAFGLPLEVDECVYAYTGQRLLAGDQLYTDVWDHHPFGGYALFAGAIALFGDAPVVFRWMAVVFSIASLALIWSLARRLAGTTAAVIAGYLFALASSDPATAGEGCNREIYINSFILAAWLLALRKPTASKPAVLASGALLAVGSAFKMVVAVHWVALACFLLVCARRSGGSWRRAVTLLMVFAMGPFALWIGTAAYFALTGRWDAFLDATILFNLGYAGGGEPILRFLRFFDPLQQASPFYSALPLWLAAAAATMAGAFFCARGQRDRYAPLLLYLSASYVAVCLPGHFFGHYYYLMMPPLVLLVAVACDGFGRWGVHALGKRSCLRWLPSGALMALLLLTQWTHYLSQPPSGITGPRYQGSDFWARAIGRKLAGVTDPDDTVFVYGNAAGIYYYAKRRCASRHIMLVGLAEGSRGVELHRRQLLEDLRRDRPRVIILLFNEPPFPAWKAFLNAHYSQPVGWDRHDRNPESVVMYVLEDPEQPIESIDWNWSVSEAVAAGQTGGVRKGDR